MNRILYIIFIGSEDQFIVGWENNGWYGRVCDSLSGFISGINASKKRINLVELGYNNHWFIHHENNTRFATDFNSWLKDNAYSNKHISVGLW